MSVSKYISEVKTANHNSEVIYNYLSNFNNLGRFINESTLENIAKQVPQIKIESFESDADSCRFSISPIGQAGLEIIDREPFKTIKIAGSGNLPGKILIWIQIVPVSPYQSKLRITLHAELNMMLKMMAGKKLKDGVDKLAEMLSLFPYTQA
jgi:carbon monoxide dehydrogenase subunit G